MHLLNVLAENGGWRHKIKTLGIEWLSLSRDKSLLPLLGIVLVVLILFLSVLIYWLHVVENQMFDSSGRISLAPELHWHQVQEGEMDYNSRLCFHIVQLMSWRFRGREIGTSMKRVLLMRFLWNSMRRFPSIPIRRAQSYTEPSNWDAIFHVPRFFAVTPSVLSLSRNRRKALSFKHSLARPVICIWVTCDQCGRFLCDRVGQSRRYALCWCRRTWNRSLTQTSQHSWSALSCCRKTWSHDAGEQKTC